MFFEIWCHRGIMISRPIGYEPIVLPLNYGGFGAIDWTRTSMHDFADR